MAPDSASGPRVIAIVTDAFGSPDSVAELRRMGDSGAAIRLVVPAVEATPFRHTLGDIDTPREEAEKRLMRALEAARQTGIEAGGEVGDPDPVQAAQDALFKEAADEIVIFSHADDEQAWYEGGLFQHAKESLEPPLRLIVVDGGPNGDERVVDVETAGAGEEERPGVIDTAYFSGLTRADYGGMVIGVVGTIIVIVLAAAGASGGSISGWGAVAIGVAIATALVNMAHVVGLMLMGSVAYYGRFARLFQRLALAATPAAIIATAVIAASD